MSKLTVYNWIASQHMCIIHKSTKFQKSCTYCTKKIHFSLHHLGTSPNMFKWGHFPIFPSKQNQVINRQTHCYHLIQRPTVLMEYLQGKGPTVLSPRYPWVICTKIIQWMPETKASTKAKKQLVLCITVPHLLLNLEWLRNPQGLRQTGSPIRRHRVYVLLHSTIADVFL